MFAMRFGLTLAVAAIGVAAMAQEEPKPKRPQVAVPT